MAGPDRAKLGRQLFRSCVVFLVLAAAAWFVIGRLLTSVPDPLRNVFAALASFFLALGIFSFWGLLTGGGSSQHTRSPILLIGKIAALIIVLVVVPLGANFFASTMIDPLSASNIRLAGWLITAVIVAVQFVGLIIAWLKLRSTMYLVTDQRVMIEQGILSKTVNEIDLRYVDDSQFFQGLTDRILGIGNVTLISTDKSTPTYMLRSVRDPRAVRELIRSHAYHVSQRQIFTRAT